MKSKGKAKFGEEEKTHQDVEADDEDGVESKKRKASELYNEWIRSYYTQNAHDMP